MHSYVPYCARARALEGKNTNFIIFLHNARAKRAHEQGIWNIAIHHPKKVLKTDSFAPISGKDMQEERCNVDLGPHETKGYTLYVKGDCDKVLNDIKSHLGEYGLKYFESKLVFEKNGGSSSPLHPTTNQNTEPMNEVKTEVA